MEITRLRIEHMKSPIGIDITHPVLSWNICDGKQDSYHVTATGDKGTFYDSGEMKSSEMLFRFPVSFQEKEKVDISLQIGKQTAKTSFEMGLAETDWKAQWICPELEVPKENESVPASYLRTFFEIPETKLKNSSLKKLRLYATCHGIYNIYINGKHVDGFIMAPGVSEYHKLLQYQTYDVSSYIKAGQNEILAVIGNGWWRGTTTYDGIKNSFGSEIAFLAQLELDGNIICKTDSNWMATQNGPLRMTDNMLGETYDATKEDLSGWHKVKTETFGYKNLCCSNCPPPLEHETFHPALIVTPKGETVLDFGQNIAGYIGFSLNAHEGEHYRFIHGETLDGDGNFYMQNFQSPNFYCSQEINYICKEGKNIYKASNTFMGFRYVKVEGMETIDPNCFTAYAVYSDLEETAKFWCGNPDVEKLFQNAMWSLKGNLLDIPTDCPTREKSGFTGDLLAFSHTFFYLMDCYPMIHKFIRNEAAGQYEDGCIRQIVADSRERGAMDGAAGWCNAFEVLSDRIDKWYGEDTVFEENYESIKRWIDFLVKRAADKTREEYLGNPFHKYLDDTGAHWGEWAEPGMKFGEYMLNIRDHGEPEVGTAYYSYACQILSKQAERLAEKYKSNEKESRKYSKDAEYYRARGRMAQQAYRFEFTQDGQINSERMCRYIRPITLNLLSEAEKKNAAENLNQLVIKNQYKLNTGFLTTHELCRTLSEYGYTETAYHVLLNENIPGWLYPVKHGATTIPENWLVYQPDGSRKDSMNHYAYGAIAGWLMDTVAGIRISGRKITICPKPFKDLKYAKAEYLSPAGMIESEWEYLKNQIKYRIKIPDNCTAKFYFPSGKKMELKSGINEITGEIYEYE